MNNQNIEIAPVQNVYPEMIPTELIPVIGIGESTLPSWLKDALDIHSSGLTIGSLDVVIVNKDCGHSTMEQ